MTTTFLAGLGAWSSLAVPLYEEPHPLVRFLRGEPAAAVGMRVQESSPSKVGTVHVLDRPEAVFTIVSHGSTPWWVTVTSDARPDSVAEFGTKLGFDGSRINMRPSNPFDGPRDIGRVYGLTHLPSNWVAFSEHTNALHFVHESLASWVEPGGIVPRTALTDGGIVRLFGQTFATSRRTFGTPVLASSHISELATVQFHYNLPGEFTDFLVRLPFPKDAATPNEAARSLRLAEPIEIVVRFPTGLLGLDQDVNGYRRLLELLGLPAASAMLQAEKQDDAYEVLGISGVRGVLRIGEEESEMRLIPADRPTPSR